MPADSEPIDLEVLFPFAEHVEIEIGFGAGESLVNMAAANHNRGYLGIEVYRPGIGQCMLNLSKLGINNVRVLEMDARDAIEQKIRPRSVHAIHILFPDPWPKKRHHKRRLLGTEFLSLCASRLRPDGLLNIATDCEDYAQTTLSTLEHIPQLRNAESTGGFYEGEPIRPRTRYETKALARKDRIYELLFCCAS